MTINTNLAVARSLADDLNANDALTLVAYLMDRHRFAGMIFTPFDVELRIHDALGRLNASPDEFHDDDVATITGSAFWRKGLTDALRTAGSTDLDELIEDYLIETGRCHDGTVEGATCSDHPDVLLTDGCYKCDPDDYITFGDGIYVNKETWALAKGGPLCGLCDGTGVWSTTHPEAPTTLASYVCPECAGEGVSR